MMPPWLAARGICKTVRDGTTQTVILDNVNLRVGPAEHVALVGPSGSGKSTLLQIVGALDPHYQGEVEVLGQALRGQSDAALSRLRNSTFGFVFQAYNLLAHLSVLDNVLLPARFAQAAADPRRAEALLARVGLQGKSKRRPATLSGGERQRVAIARALYMRPKVLLCDEPTGNLDRRTAAGVAELFDDLRRDNVALLVATHDVELARGAHRQINLAQGRLQ